MVIKKYFSSVFIFVVSILSAQEGLPFYEHYLLSDTYLINPSYAGKDENIIKLRGTYHTQWSNIEDAPTTQTLSGHLRIANRLAVGSYVYNDTNGATQTSGVNLTAAYHIPIGDGYAYDYKQENSFSFGLSYNVLFQSFDKTKWIAQHPNDPLLTDDSYVNNYFNIGGSFHYNGVYGGISILDLPLGDNQYIVNSLEPLPSWYYFNLGYRYNLTDYIQLEPSVLMNLNSNSERQLDLAMRSRLSMERNAVILGVNYRTDIDNNGTQGLSLTPLINFEIGNLRLGYAYRLGLTDISQDAGDTHLINLGYDFSNPFSFR